MGSATPQPEPDAVISLRITREQRDALRRIAIQNERTLSQEFRFIVGRRIREVSDEEQAA